MSLPTNPSINLRRGEGVTTATLDLPKYSVSNEGIDLKVRQNPEGNSDSLTDIVWCISAGMKEELIQKGAVDPLLLLVVSHDGIETNRVLVSLAAEMCQIGFRRSGTNTVYAVAVWKEKGSDINLRKVMMRNSTTVLTRKDPVQNRLRDELNALRENLNSKQRKLMLELAKVRESPVLSDNATEAEREIFELEQLLDDTEHRLAVAKGEILPEPPDPELIASLEAEIAELAVLVKAADEAWTARYMDPVYEASLCSPIIQRGDFDTIIPSSENTGQHDVVIPASMFGKSWEITKKLGTIYNWPQKATNNCHLRKRAIFTACTYWPKWIGKGIAVFFMELLDLILVAGMLLCGLKGINYQVLRHPLTKTPRQLWYRRHLYSIWFFKKSENGTEVRRSRFFLAANPILIVTFGLGAWIAFRDPRALLLGLAALVTLGLLMLVIGAAIEGPIRKLADRIGTALDVRATKRYRRALNETHRDLTHLTCGLGEPKLVGENRALPRRNRVSYIVHNTKAKVCKPFEGA